MEYRMATEKDTEQIFMLVQHTIKSIYPKYYPKEIVDFFCSHHSEENISRDIKDGLVSILQNDSRIVGTGCYKDNYITRVYVDPACQGQGHGSYIMQCLEDKITLQHNSVILDASLPASHLYETRGYQTIKHERLTVENDVILVYEVMEKDLARLN